MSSTSRTPITPAASRSGWSARSRRVSSRSWSAWAHWRSRAGGSSRRYCDRDEATRLMPDPPSGHDDHRERHATWLVAVGFAITTAAAIGLAITYSVGGQSQVEGILLALALGGLGFGFVVVAKELLPQGPYTEEREPLESTAEEISEFEADFER